jgi:hypothetical protein
MPYYLNGIQGRRSRGGGSKAAEVVGGEGEALDGASSWRESVKKITIILKLMVQAF